MITVTNLQIQFGKKVLYKDVNLKFTPTVRANQPCFVPSAVSWNPIKERWRCSQASA